VRTQGTAFAWAFGRQHRPAFLALGGYLAALAALRLLEVTTGLRLVTGWGPTFAFVIVVPGTVALYWLIVAFTYGYAGNIADRQSILPTRLFTLPVPNASLAGWPMLLGGAAVALLWIGTRIVAPWPEVQAVAVPYVWPGLLAVVLLLWMQGIVWMSYPLPGMRVGVAVVGLSAIQVAAVFAIETGASEAFMISILAPQIPLAYLLARHAVVRARRGEVADWSGAFEPVRRALTRRALGRPPFESARAAQLWIEWKRYGRSLPAIVGILLPVELIILWAAGGAAAVVFAILVVVALTPPFVASFTAVAVRRSGEGEDFGVPPFTGTRPLSSAELIGARLRMAAWSTGAAWLLVVVAAPAALVLSGTWEIVADRAGRFAGVVGTRRATVFGALVFATLVLTTWRQMVQSLYLGLTGRTRLIRGSALAMLLLLVVIGPFLDWAWSTDLRAWFWVALYWTLGVIVAARTALGCWTLTRLQRDGLVSDRALVVGAAGWLAAVIALYGVLLWFFATPYVPRFLLLMIATVAVPLVRLSAAPLALAWNRHR
jgi:hypothetical protein